MKDYNSFSDLWADLENNQEYLTEKNILKFTLQLHQFMEQRGISKKELAEQIGSSQAYITKVFKGNANFTIASMTKLVHAMGGRLTFHVTGKEEKNPTWFRKIDGKKNASSQWASATKSEYQIDILEHVGA
jgi:transcriptional regulator with XRE-family HTH domain